MQMRLVWVLAAVGAAACGSADGTATAPTVPIVAATSNANGGTSGTKSDSGRASTAAVVEGTVSALGGACPKITFTVAGKSFATDSLTRFGDAGCAAVKNDAKVGVAYQTLASGLLRVLAVKVLPPPPPPPVVVEGTVSGLSGTCPRITFTVAGRSFTTDSLTRYGDGGCAAVKNDVKVALRAQTSSAGTVRVLALKVLPPPPPPPVAVQGTVSGLSGACPKITFTVDGQSFTTDSLTRFGDAGCAAVKNDVKVGVAYQTLTSGAVRVLMVKLIPPPPPPPVIVGEVTAVTGTCPAITITAAGKTAVTSAATVFSGKSCQDVKVGSKVGIYGTVAAGATSLAASRVIIR